MGSFMHLVVVEFFLEVFAVGEEVEELEGGLLGCLTLFLDAVVEELLTEVVLARAAAFDLDEVGGREDRAEEAEIQDVRAVVAGGHHADGHADPGLAGLVGREEVGRAEQVVVGEVDGELLGVGDLRGDLHGEVGLVLAGKHPVGHLVEDLRELGGVVLADGEDDGLADLAADGIAQGVFQERLAEELVGGVGEERFSNSRCLKASFWSSPSSSVKVDDEALFGKQLGGDLGAGVHHGGVDQEAVLHAVQQGVAEGGLARPRSRRCGRYRAAGGARASRGSLVVGFVLVEVLEVVPRRGGEAELVADEVVEDGAGVAADGAVRFVGDHEVEIGGRKELLVLVVEQQRLNGGDDDFRVAPVVAVLFVDDGLEVVGSRADERLLGLVLEFQAVHQEEDAAGRCRSGGRA